MTDRELLELAAKAAGIDLSAAFWGGGRDGFYWVIEARFGRIKYWNPLTDDADALRLAVKLQFEIDLGFESIAIRHSVGIKILEDFNGDPEAATRRAIVRAAAEVERNMK
jgi:hypothetical protein